MEFRKIKFNVKDDVEMQKQSHFDKCNYDCTVWYAKNLAEKLNSSTSKCFSVNTAKGNIWW